MKPVAIIPARRGSKRLQNKNQQVIGSETLLERAVTQAHRLFGSNVILTSDYGRDALSEFYRSHPYTRAHVARPADLCTDTATMMDVVRHALGVIGDGHWGVETDYDYVVLLQPTSPLRLDADIFAVLDHLDGGAEACISVVPALKPELFTVGHAGRLRPIHLNDQRGTAVKPNGAVYAIRRDVLEAGFDWWTASVVEGYVMPPERSVDIDTVYDLEEARRLWTEQTNI